MYSTWPAIQYLVHYLVGHTAIVKYLEGHTAIVHYLAGHTVLGPLPVLQLYTLTVRTHGGQHPVTLRNTLLDWKFKEYRV